MSHNRIRTTGRRIVALAALMSGALLAILGLAGAAFAQVKPPDLPAGRPGGAPPIPPTAGSGTSTPIWAFVAVAVAAVLLTLAVVGSWRAFRRSRRRPVVAV